MKKHISLLCLVSVMISVTACDGSKNEKSPDGTSSAAVTSSNTLSDDGTQAQTGEISDETTAEQQLNDSQIEETIYKLFLEKRTPETLGFSLIDLDYDGTPEILISNKLPNKKNSVEEIEDSFERFKTDIYKLDGGGVKFIDSLFTYDREGFEFVISEYNHNGEKWWFTQSRKNLESGTEDEYVDESEYIFKLENDKLNFTEAFSHKQKSDSEDMYDFDYYAFGEKLNIIKKFSSEEDGYTLYEYELDGFTETCDGVYYSSQMIYNDYRRKILKQNAGNVYNLATEFISGKTGWSHYSPAPQLDLKNPETVGFTSGNTFTINENGEEIQSDKYDEQAKVIFDKTGIIPVIIENNEFFKQYSYDEDCNIIGYPSETALKEFYDVHFDNGYYMLIVCESNYVSMSYYGEDAAKMLELPKELAYHCLYDYGAEDIGEFLKSAFCFLEMTSYYSNSSKDRDEFQREILNNYSFNINKIIAHPDFISQSIEYNYSEFKNGNEHIKLSNYEWFPDIGGKGKPVIYLYPEQETTINVKLDLSPINGHFTCVYPEYNQKTGWTVTAYPDGTIINKNDGLEYYCLYWEGEGKSTAKYETGFCVSSEDTASFLREKLTQLGLSARELNEFIIYWLPILERNPYNLIEFQTEDYNRDVPIEIIPKPDSCLRIFMAYKPLSEAVNIPAQNLKSFDRSGFSVIEWGGGLVR